MPKKINDRTVCGAIWEKNPTLEHFVHFRLKALMTFKKSQILQWHLWRPEGFPGGIIRSIMLLETPEGMTIFQKQDLLVARVYKIDNQHINNNNIMFLYKYNTRWVQKYP